MLEVYTTEMLKEITPTGLIAQLKLISFDKNGCAVVRVPPDKKIEYGELKNKIEYKYYMPIVFNGDSLWFNKYSTAKLLTLLAGKLKISIRSKKTIELQQVMSDAIHSTVYAAGAIERAPDHGVGFRNACHDIFRRTKIDIISPCDFTYNKTCHTLAKHGTENDILTHYKFSRMIVAGDLKAVASCDATIVNIDQYLGVGTTSEATVAFALQKPLYGILAKDYQVNQVSPWLLGTMTRVFSSLQEFRDFVVNGE